MSYVVFTDSFSNLPGSILHSLEIRVMPCTYQCDGVTVHYDGNIENFDAHAFYEGMRQGKVIRTSLTNTQTFLDAFRPALEEGKDIVYVGLSSGVSGTYQSAVIAANELSGEFPDRTIRTVDSLGASLGTGILACRAADLRDKTADEAAEILERERWGLCEFFTVGDLKYLARTGRINPAVAAIGNVLNLKPLLYGDDQGHIVAGAKYRGRARAVAAMLEKYEKKAVDPAHCRVAISHGDCEEEAQALAQRVCQIAKPRELLVLPHEPFSGSHVGPGMLALYFFGDSRR